MIWMIPLIPYKHLRLHSINSVEAVTKLLLRVVSPDLVRFNRNSNDLTLFWGSVGSDRFIIVRNLNYGEPRYPWITHRNPFTPILHGNLYPDKSGSKIELRMVMAPLITLFCLGFYAFFVFSIVYLTRQWVISGSFSPGLYSAWIGLVSFYLGNILSFGVESNRAIDLLKKSIGERV